MKIDVAAARTLFDRLSPALRIASLSPDYVVADAMRTPTLQPTFWHYQEDDSFWYHGFHLSPLPGIDGFDIQSPYGYGGPLSNSTDSVFLARAWRAYGKAVRLERVCAEFTRFHPLADNRRFFAGRIDENRPTVWVDLRADDLFAQYQPRVRTAIRKAESAHIEFAWLGNEHIHGRFADFYRAGMSAIAATPFYFFPNEYFAAMAAWSSVKLAVCSIDGEWLAAALFLHEGDCVEYHLAASTDAGKRYSANNMLLHCAASSAKAHGYGRLYLGGGTDCSPDNPLYFYKSGYSRHRSTFSVGTFCHDADRYECLKQRWPDLYRGNPGSLFFYR